MPSTAVVTGTSRGVGLQLVKTLLDRGWHVIATCRKATDELSALASSGKSIEVLTDVDVGLDDGCKSLEKLDHSHIDLVICNAGLFVNGGLDDLNYDDIRKCFEVNALGPLRTVQALRPKLRAGSKVVVIGSLMGSISNNMNGARYAYRMSKCACHQMTVTLAADLRSQEIPVAVVHPGVVITAMTKISRSNATVTVEESADGILARAEQIDMTNTGRYWDWRGFILPW